MIVPTPRLDDRTFEQLRTQAVEFVRNRHGAWDDLGDGDPGTILLEAFAYLTDVLLYRVNRVPDKARREFLGLIGVHVAPPGAASATLQFERSGADSSDVVVVPAATRVQATDSSGGDPVVFVTNEPVRIEAGAPSVTVGASQCGQVEGELLGISTGEAGQQFALHDAPVVLPTGHELDLVIAVEASTADLEDRPDAVAFDDRAFGIWDIVESFVGVPTASRVVRVDRASGLVSFAPAVRAPLPDGGIAAHPMPLAQVPPAGRQVRAWYRIGGGSRGNVGPGTLTTFDGPAPAAVTVTNPNRAVGGCDAESMDQALRRAPELFHEPRRAVTADDFEALARRAGGVARARAITEAEHWAHATAGTVEVRLVPSVDDADGPPGAARLEAGQQEPLLDRVRQTIRRQQPLGIRSVVRWAQYKEVTVHLRVVVGRSEDPGAVKRRVEQRLHGVLSPTPVTGNESGWPFGRALRASNVYNAVFSEPGVRYADRIVMELGECPDGDVGALAADRFQPNSWYVAQAGTLFRSENGGLGWEAVHTFASGTIMRIIPSDDRPGHLAVIVAGDDEHSSRVHVSPDCGSTWPPEPVLGFSWSTEDNPQVVRDVCWVPAAHGDLLVATDRGLYRVGLDEATPRPWIVDPSAPDKGCWTAAVSPTGDGRVEVAVAMQSRGGVWLIGPDLEGQFRNIGLDDVDVRRLLVERRNIRSFLWAPTFAVGDDIGTGCHRAELRGRDDLPTEWSHLGAGWNGGICHDLAFLGDRVLAASEFNGVLTLDQGHAEEEATWQPPSVQTSGLPLLENRRFQPVRSIDAASDVALVGTGRSVFRTRDGAAYSDAARRRVNDLVTLPASWLFASGTHEVTVEVETR